jgi:hypothetical protein
MKKVSVVLLLVFGCCLSLNASRKKNALPESVTSAKAIYVVNETVYKDVGDTAYEELEKWGRFKVVHERKSADLILHFFAFGNNGGGGFGMFVTTADSDDRLFQTGKQWAVTPSGQVRKDIDAFEKWVDEK